MTLPISLRPPAPSRATTPPYLLLVVQASERGRLNTSALRSHLVKVVGSDYSEDPVSWETFARDQGLMIEGSLILSSPTYWLKSTTKWIAVLIPAGNKEAQIFIGWNRPGQPGPAYSHIDLIKHCRNLPESVRRFATPWLERVYSRVRCSGYSFIGGHDARIHLVSKEPYTATVWDNENRAAFVALALAMTAGGLRSGDASPLNVFAWIVLTVIGVLIYSLLRYFWVLPSAKWTIDGIGN